MPLSAAKVDGTVGRESDSRKLGLSQNYRTTRCGGPGGITGMQIYRTGRQAKKVRRREKYTSSAP